MQSSLSATLARRLVIVLSLASLVALSTLFLFTETSGAGKGSGSTEPCQIPSDYSLAAQQDAPKDSHFPYQEWVANPEAQRGVASANAAFTQRFGSSDETDHLAAGLLGFVTDHHAQELVLVVDEAFIDVDQTEKWLKSKMPANSLNVRVGVSCHSASNLRNAQEMLRAAQWHPDAAAADYGFHIDAHTSTISVTFDAGDTDIAQALKDRLGDLVSVEFGDVGPRGRLDDGEPHWGGAGIRKSSDSQNVCTSGFTAVQPDGSLGSVTAGHCFNDGNQIYSGPEYYGESRGESEARWDMIRIHPRGEAFQRKIHTDPCCPVVRNVVAANDPVVSDFVCLSGMVTKAVCGVEITRVDAELRYNGVNHTNMIKGVKPGELVGQGGDSGSPVYQRYGSDDAAIKGMQTAGTAFDNFYGFKVSTIRNQLGISGIVP